MIDLKAHYADSARRFLQTAIVIDDQAHFGPTITTVVPVLHSPTGSVLGTPDGPGEPAVAVTVEQDAADQQTGSLNAKVLTHAFMARDMICGLYRPEPGEAMVDRTAGAAKLADIVVVDWYLEPGSSRSAKEIVVRLLKSDRADNGRLRLIAVYTSQPGREAIAGELLGEIEGHSELSGMLLQDGPALVGSDTRIIVLNKRNTQAAADLEEVNEETLPDRLISEFACLSQSLLASFSLSAVAAIRKGAHHVLALYTGDLDGAFVAHRAGIPHPDDSRAFALDMLVTELRNLVELEDVPERQLGGDVIEAWVQSKVASDHKFRGEQAEITPSDVQTFVRGGADAFKASLPRQHAHGDPSQLVAEGSRVPISKVSRIFYPDSPAARRAVQRLARLTTFQREPGRTRIPEDWSPLLTLGTLLQEIQAEGKHGAAEILLCVQPRCDSVRLKKRTPFPMQGVSLSGDHFNIILRDSGSVVQEAWVSLKPMDTVMVQFDPDAARRGVIATRDQDRYIFSSVDGRRWLWLGDMKEMKAQQWAMDLGSRISGVGMDEMELMRLAAERKLKRNWTA